LDNVIEVDSAPQAQVNVHEEKTFELNGIQSKAYGLIEYFLRSTALFFVLKGYAGTGLL